MPIYVHIYCVQVVQQLAYMYTYIYIVCQLYYSQPIYTYIYIVFRFITVWYAYICTQYIVYRLYNS